MRFQLSLQKGMLLGLLACLLIPIPVLAQEGGDSLPIQLRRDFGFGAGIKIQGRFTLLVPGEADYSVVEFYYDGQLMHTDRDAPFEYAFDTDSLNLGIHTLQVVGVRADGDRIESMLITREIVTAEEGWGVAAKIVGPVLGITLLVTLFGVAGPMFLAKDRKGFVPGRYGPMGGTVCPRCSLPFSRPFLAPNLLVGKLVRCPHCGKMAVLPAANPEILRLAEERYRSENEGGALEPGTQEESLRKQIEDSRFES